MAQNVEKLIVELDAKVSGYLDGMEKANKKNEKTRASSEKLSKAIKATAAAMTAASVAVIAAVKSASDYAREIQVAASRTKESVEEMQALAFAANTVGVSLEKLGDMGKDTNEKIGEFLATGGGGFMDFVDVMKLTKEEGKALAKTFQDMSGTDVLKEMVRQMEAAGVSSNQMSFALEGLASDATDLIPLLKNNGEELNKLSTEFKALDVTISQEELKSIKQAGIELDKLGKFFGAKGRKFVADYAKEIITSFNLVKKAVIATSDSVDQFQNVLGITISQLTKDSKDLTVELDSVAAASQSVATFLKDAFVNLPANLKASVQIAVVELLNFFDDVAAGATLFAHELDLSLAKALPEFAQPTEYIDWLEKQIELTKQKQDISDQTLEKMRENILAERDTAISAADDIAKARQKNREDFDLVTGFDAADPELLNATAKEERLQAEIDAQKLANEKKLELEQEFIDALNELKFTGLESKEEIFNKEVELHRVMLEKKLINEEEFNKSQEQSVKKLNKVKDIDVKTTKKSEIEKLNTKQNSIQAGIALNNALFEDNKAIAAGFIVADTATGIQKSLAINPYDYVNVGIIAATGAVNLANALSANKGGGSISSAPSGGGLSVTNQQADFAPETTSLELTAAEVGGGQDVTRIEFSTDTGDSLVDAISSALNESLKKGK